VRETRLGVDWGTYEPYVPPHPGLLGEMTRADAKHCYQRLMAALPGRFEQLGGLLHANGLTLSDDDSDLDALESWFDAHVEPASEDSSRLANLWYSVVNDLGLFLGDVAIRRFIGSSSSGVQRTSPSSDMSSWGSPGSQMLASTSTSIGWSRPGGTASSQAPASTVVTSRAGLTRR